MRLEALGGTPAGDGGRDRHRIPPQSPTSPNGQRLDSAESSIGEIAPAISKNRESPLVVRASAGLTLSGDLKMCFRSRVIVDRGRAERTSRLPSNRGGRFDMPPLAELALLFVVGLGVAFVAWVVVRLMARHRPH